MVLYVGDQLAGFTFGESLSPVQCSILIEKTHPMYHGAAQFIFSEFCRRHWVACPECNAGDDWGIPSLRFTKTTYRPKRMLNKYILTRQPVVVASVLVPESRLSTLSQPGPATDLPVAADPDLILKTEPSSMAVGDPTLPFILRPATPGDIPALLQLEESCFEHSAERFNPRQIRELIRNPRAIVLVAATEHQVIGWSAGLLRWNRGTRSARLYALAVAPYARGFGCAKAMTGSLCRQFSDNGAGRIYLEVRPDNLPAIRLYEQFGFQTIRQLPDYYDTGIHAVKMIKTVIGFIDVTERKSTAAGSARSRNHS